jgi:two-component system nitrogen regulation response regulator GlnG
MDGIEALRRVKSISPSTSVIMMTAHSTSERAIMAMKLGAYDYLAKPFENRTLLELIEKALMDRKISVPVTFNESAEEPGDKIVGRSPQMVDIFKKIGQVSRSDVTVLLRGETGTGKELIARAIYQHSDRAGRVFLPVNCSAIPETLLESELFGHEKGAFTGAAMRRIGKFEQCDGGTMFLDEIGDMPVSIQSKWLRVLQDGCFERLGGKECITTDVRIIAATNRDLDSLMKEEKFREDLYWRLNVVTIDIPPLRDRRDDIEHLVSYFIRRFNGDLGKNVMGIEPGLLEEFRRYHWPGNVRELQAVIQKGMILCQKELLTAEDCEWRPAAQPAASGGRSAESIINGLVEQLIDKSGPGIYREAVASFEKNFIRKVLAMCDNNQVAAAKLLGISRNTLRARLGKD